MKFGIRNFYWNLSTHSDSGLNRTTVGAHMKTWCVYSRRGHWVGNPRRLISAICLTNWGVLPSWWRHNPHTFVPSTQRALTIDISDVIAIICIGHIWNSGELSLIFWLAFLYVRLFECYLHMCVYIRVMQKKSFKLALQMLVWSVFHFVDTAFKQ
jgi:hypothetical protein